MSRQRSMSSDRGREGGRGRPYHGYDLLLDLGRERDQAEESGEVKLRSGRVSRTQGRTDRGRNPHTELNSSPAEIVSIARVIAAVCGRGKKKKRYCERSVRAGLERRFFSFWCCGWCFSMQLLRQRWPLQPRAVPRPRRATTPPSFRTAIAITEPFPPSPPPQQWHDQTQSMSQRQSSRAARPQRAGPWRRWRRFWRSCRSSRRTALSCSSRRRRGYVQMQAAKVRTPALSAPQPGS